MPSLRFVFIRFFSAEFPCNIHHSKEKLRVFQCSKHFMQIFQIMCMSGGTGREQKSTLPWFMRCRSPGVMGSPVHSSPHGARSPNPECLEMKKLRWILVWGKLWKTCFVCCCYSFPEFIYVTSWDIYETYIETIWRLLRFCGDIWVGSYSCCQVAVRFQIVPHVLIFFRFRISCTHVFPGILWICEDCK